MFWNTIPNNERLSLWKDLRVTINNIPLESQLSSIASFCASIPFGARTLDYYSTENWPTPWEILFHGSFCTSSISLLMFYTLSLLDNPPPVNLFLVEDENVYLLPVIADQFVLNFELGQVNNYSEIQNNFKVLKKYNKEDIRNIT